MNKTILFAMALAAVCIMPSCGKDLKPSDEPSIEPTAEMIVFGNHTYMDVVTYDHVDWEYHDDYTSYYWKDIDVNGRREICERIKQATF